MTHFQHTITGLAGHGEVNEAAQSFSKLQAITTGLHNSIDEYLLIHYILSPCALCKKLGGQ